MQAYYNAHKDEYRTPERVHARHILLSIANKPKDEVPKIQAQAEALLKQIKAGGDFAELAKKNSQDPGSAAKGRRSGLGFARPDGENFRRRGLHVEAQRDQQRGHHRIRLPYHSGAGEAARASANSGRSEAGHHSHAQESDVFDRMQELTDKAHAELVKSPQNAQQIATQLNLEFVDVPAYAPGAADRATRK